MQRLELPDDEGLRLGREAAASDAVSIRRRERADEPYAWSSQVRHFGFVSVIILLAIMADGVFARLSVILLAFAYVLILAGLESAKSHGYQVSIDDEGVRQTIGTHTESASWSELRSYTTPRLSLSAMALQDERRNAVLLAGRSLGPAAGPATIAVWTRLARAIRSRLPFTREASGRVWHAWIRGESLRMLCLASGIVLCLSPTLLGSAQIAGSLGLALLLGVLALVGAALPNLLAFAAVPEDASEVFSSANHGSDEVEAFLDARKFQFDPVPMEHGRRYRYVAPKTLFAWRNIEAMGFLPLLPELTLFKAVQFVRIEWVFYVVLAFVLASRIPGILHWWFARSFRRWREGRFWIEGSDLVAQAREGGREFRFPLDTRRTWTLTQYWFEAGGEVEEYRCGWRRILIDRRFLVPAETVGPNGSALSDR